MSILVKAGLLAAKTHLMMMREVLRKRGAQIRSHADNVNERLLLGLLPGVRTGHLVEHGTNFFGLAGVERVRFQ